MTQAYLIFHLNLAFSSISESKRPVVIERCYTPLLDLVELHGLPIGVEMTGWTLRQIQALSPNWVSRFRRLLSEGRCELVGSGYVQMIGPLVPHAVNQWNQQLGLEDYASILGQQPRLVLVNEMAFSSGLVPIYRQAGYQGMVMDRDNIRLALDLQDHPYESVPSHALGPSGETLPVLWSDSILFQKLQRIAHGEISQADYLHYFHKRAASATRPLAAYCNDTEIFDFRPGRFAEEAALQNESEWVRITQLLDLLTVDEHVAWLSPSEALAASIAAAPSAALSLTSIRQPVPVKKQAKYNLSRWAVSGRNDLWLNSKCHQLLKNLANNNDPYAWRTLCELWASDLRTHITAERWQESLNRLEHLLTKKESQASNLPIASSTLTKPNDWTINESSDGIFIKITTPNVKVILNRRKGLTIHRLAFRSHGFTPTVGTLPHGYFESINYGADFYTGGVIIELPVEHRRITDLAPVTPQCQVINDMLAINASIVTPAGPIDKTISISLTEERVSLGYVFTGWSRPRGIVRVGTTTLLPDAFIGPLTLACHNGGAALEKFPLDRDCEHTLPSSSLVSCTTGLGATGGEILLGDSVRNLILTWDPASTAAFPMLIHQQIPPSHLTRIVFSLSELDDTSRPEGMLGDFCYSIEPKYPSDF